MSKEQQNKNRFWVLTHIKELHESFENDELEYNLKESASLDRAPILSIQIDIIRHLHREGIIKILHEIPETLDDGISVKATADCGGFTIVPIGFRIEIQHPQFDEIQKKQFYKAPEIYVSEFYDSKSLLKINSRGVPLPAFTNEHYLCRVMFEYMVGEWVDWSVIYEKMTGNEPNNEVKNSRMVRDAMYALNERVREIAKIDKDLLDWKNKSLKRIF